MANIKDLKAATGARTRQDSQDWVERRNLRQQTMHKGEALTDGQLADALRNMEVLVRKLLTLPGGLILRITEDSIIRITEDGIERAVEEL